MNNLTQPPRRGAQCNCMGCIGLKPALVQRIISGCGWSSHTGLPDLRSFQPLHYNNMMVVIGWLILILQQLQTFVQLARCERVMITWAEFHFSWVYTFSATPRCLRTWAPVPPRETGCDPALHAQLCWSCGSSLQHTIRSIFGMLCTYIHQSRGNDLMTFRLFGALCFFNCYGFFLVLEILNFRQMNSTKPQLVAVSPGACELPTLLFVVIFHRNVWR